MHGVERWGSAESTGAEGRFRGVSTPQQSRNGRHANDEIGALGDGERLEGIPIGGVERATARTGVINELVHGGTKGIDGSGASRARGVGLPDEGKIRAGAVGGRAGLGMAYR